MAVRGEGERLLAGFLRARLGWRRAGEPLWCRMDGPWRQRAGGLQRRAGGPWQRRTGALVASLGLAFALAACSGAVPAASGEGAGSAGSTPSAAGAAAKPVVNDAAFEPDPIGWVEDEDGIRRYLDVEGEPQVGWIDDGSGKRYWVKPEDGLLADHEWVEVDGTFLAFDSDGSLVTLGEVVPEGDAERMEELSPRQQALLDACETTPWPGSNLCARWISDVFGAAGLAAPGGNACDMAAAWCSSDDLAELEPGMILGVTTHGRTDNGRIWGHIAIYAGNGYVWESGAHGIRYSSLGSWLAWFGDTVTPRWGWANGIDLSE